jgi:hypothetical protein
MLSVPNSPNSKGDALANIACSSASVNTPRSAVRSPSTRSSFGNFCMMFDATYSQPGLFDPPRGVAASCSAIPSLLISNARSVRAAAKRSISPNTIPSTGFGAFAASRQRRQANIGSISHPPPSRLDIRTVARSLCMESGKDHGHQALTEFRPGWMHDFQ